MRVWWRDRADSPGLGAAVNRAMAINDAMRPAGHAMTVGKVGPADPPCDECGGDAFTCSCGPVRETFTADEVRAAIAEAEAKRAKAVSELRAFQGIVKDLRAELAARPTIVVQGSGDPLGDYLARLRIPEKRAYADAWVAYLRDGGPEPVRPDGVSWDAVDVERKVRRWARRAGVAA